MESHAKLGDVGDLVHMHGHMTHVCLLLLSSRFSQPYDRSGQARLSL